MNRTLLLLLAVLLLGGFAWWATTAGTTPESISDRSPDRQFGIASFDEDVHRIFIADRNGHKVTLSRGGITGWLADGRPANENIMKNLRDAATNLKVKSLSAEKAKPYMIKDLATSGILVQLFDKEGQKLRGYYIGGGTHDELGTHAIVEGSEEPYVVGMPFFTGSVRAIFGMWGDEWRDKVYFRINPDEVESLSIEYPTQRNRSFVLTKTKGKFRVAPFYETGQPVKEVSDGRAEGILARYESYYINSYENTDTETAAYAKTILPFANITVKEAGKVPQTISIFPRYLGETRIDDGKSTNEVSSAELQAYTAFVNDGQDWALLNVETTRPLLVSYQSF
jgi:hypothetical protein